MDIEDVIDEIALFNHMFLNRIRGATTEEIDALEVILGSPLPEVYRSFLSYMGNDMGGLEVFNADMTLTTVREYCEDALWFPPKQYTLIGEAWDDPYDDLYLDSNDTLEEPRVVRFPTYDDPSEIDEILQDCFMVEELSLPRMLFRYAFDQFLMARFPVKVRAGKYLETEGVFGQTDDILLKLGFERHRFSGPWNGYYQRCDAIAHIRKPAGYAMGLKLHGRDYKETRRIAAILKDNLGLLMHPIK